MTAQRETFPIVEFWIDKFADWIKHRRDLSEIRRMNRTDFDLIARDCGFPPTISGWFRPASTAPTKCRKC
jgi:hypothetical protein